MPATDANAIGAANFSRTARRDEKDRLSLIADAKKRQFGIDKDALDRQVAEKEAAKAAEKQRDLYFDQMGDMFSKKLTVLEQERQAMRVELARQQNEFQASLQRKEDRREFDLSDPNGLKKDRPNRIGDDDPRCGPSSLQRFAGEDLSAAERKKRQLQQQAAWCQDQVRQKQEALDRAMAAEAAFAQQAAANSRHATAIHDQLRSARANLAAATAEANSELVAARRAREAADKQAQAVADAAEIEYTSTDDLHTENPAQTISSVAPWRVRKDHFKGFNDDQKAAVLATQAAQVEELNQRRAAERNEDLAFCAQQEAIRRTLEVRALQVEDFKLAQNKAAAQFLQQQREQKTVRDADSSALFMSNVPTDEFFGRFGTSAR